MWRIFTNMTKRSEKKTPPKREDNIYKFNNICRRGHLKTSLHASLRKNFTIQKIEQNSVDWDVLENATPKTLGNLSIWAICLAAKEIPTGKVMNKRG